jgi:hypothetical protein
MLRDHESDIDQRGWERDTARDVDAAVDATFGPDVAREIDVYMFDGSVLVRHAESDGPRPGIEFDVARSLRGGRDFDATLPCDWHVVERRVESRPGLSGGEHVIGTRISLNRSLRAPADCAEASA